MLLFRSLSLRARINLAMIAIILVSFLVTGGIAIYDHYEQNEKYNLQRLERKEKSVRASLDYFLSQLGGKIPNDSIGIVFNDKICELSDVHNLFIVLYDINGRYLLSTNSATADSLGIPYVVNYTIMKQLATGNDRAVIDKAFRNDELTLAYWYFNDEKGKPIAIMNVVYDEEDAENKDLRAFLEELGQSYILLFLLAIIISWLLSRYITSSLLTIRQRMQNVQLGKHNEPIVWRGDDEIAGLVLEYNRMLAELEKSAEKLAQQERESAWRDMAKQVAHEIKNPLTPMKLRVQHLLRSWEDGAPAFGDKLKAFTITMTEQIDTLTRIANEFSHFAQMPRPSLERTDLSAILRETCDLYEAPQQLDIRLTLPPAPAIILADPDHVRRVMINLITNAQQAIPSGQDGKITVTLRPYRDWFIVRVEDNGVGIPKEMQARIFLPNFTTKSTGTGLGLSMVKGIMIQHGGSVWLRSRTGKGASFYLSFPRAAE